MGERSLLDRACERGRLARREGLRLVPEIRRLERQLHDALAELCRHAEAVRSANREIRALRSRIEIPSPIGDDFRSGLRSEIEGRVLFVDRASGSAPRPEPRARRSAREILYGSKRRD